MQNGTENLLQPSAFPRVAARAASGTDSTEAAGLCTVSLPYGMLLAIAEGTGRDTDSRTRAETILLQSLRRVLQNARVNPEDGRAMADLLRQGLHAANNELYQKVREAEEESISTASLVAALVSRGRAYVAHVGNARLYLVRNGASTRMTRDHTTAQTWIDHGIMTEEQARERPEAHSLSRALGGKRHVEPSVRSVPLRLEKGDVLALLSTGIYRHIDDDEIASIAGRVEPEHACEELCDVASTRSKIPAGKAVVFQSGPVKAGKQPRLLKQRRRRQHRRHLYFGAVVIAILALTVWAGVGFFNKEENTSQRHKVANGAAVKAESQQKSYREGLVARNTEAPEAVEDAWASGSGSPELHFYTPPPSLGDQLHHAEDLDVRTGAMEAHTSALDASATLDGIADSQPVSGDVTAGQVDVESGAESETVEQLPDLMASAEVGSTVDANEPGMAESDARIVAEVADANTPSVEYVQDQDPADPFAGKCVQSGLRGKNRRKVRDLNYLLREGNKLMEGKKKDASRAGKKSKAAVVTLRYASDTVRTRCKADVDALQRQVREFYLKLSFNSATRAMNDLDKKRHHCAKSRRMARDASTFGATPEEVSSALRICEPK
jgi:serine/threonine protein phosphatase PrpC